MVPHVTSPDMVDTDPDTSLQCTSPDMVLMVQTAPVTVTVPDGLSTIAVDDGDAAPSEYSAADSYLRPAPFQIDVHV